MYRPFLPALKGEASGPILTGEKISARRNIDQPQEYVTIRLPFSAKGEEAKRLLVTARLFKLCVHKLLDEAKSNPRILHLPKFSYMKHGWNVCKDTFPNLKYARAAAWLVYSMFVSIKALASLDKRIKKRLNIEEARPEDMLKRIELSDWLMFQSEADSAFEGNYSIRLINVNTVSVVTLTYQDIEERKRKLKKGKKKPKISKRIELKVKVSKKYKKLLEELVALAKNKQIGYTAKVYIKDWNVDRNGNLRVYGEVQIGIPYWLYLKHMKRFAKPLGNNIAGIDFNTDRLNLAILKPDGTLVETKTFWFEEVTAKGCLKERARTKIMQAIHNALKYAYYHGVSVVAIEDPEVIGLLRYLWLRNKDRKHRNWNWKVGTFRSSYIKEIARKAELYGMKVISVDPKGTSNSEEHEEVMRKYGLDRHSASAVLIAKRAVEVFRNEKFIISPGERNHGGKHEGDSPGRNYNGS